MLTEEEKREKRKERNRKYWNEHKQEIAMKRKRKRLLEKQAVKFAEDIKQDEELQALLLDLLDLRETNSGTETVVADSLRNYAEVLKNGEKETTTE